MREIEFNVIKAHPIEDNFESMCNSLGQRHFTSLISPYESVLDSGKPRTN